MDIIHFLMEGCDIYGYNKSNDVYWGKINNQLSFYMMIINNTILLYDIHIYSMSLKSFINHFVQLVDIINESA